MQQRYYDPLIGRFLSVDPVAAYGSDTRYFNRYWYAAGNPYKFTDPDGREIKPTSPEMADLVERTRASGPIGARIIGALNDSNFTHTVGSESRPGHDQSNANPTDKEGAVLRSDGTPSTGSGSVIGIFPGREEVNISLSPGANPTRTVVSDVEKLIHEGAHALRMDRGELHDYQGPSAESNRAMNEDYAKTIEDMYREEQGLEGRRQWNP